MNGPELDLPGRAYLLFRAPLTAVGDLEYDVVPNRSQLHGPSLIRPTGRGWVVASEIDLDSTIAGGGGELVEAIFAEPERRHTGSTRTPRSLTLGHRQPTPERAPGGDPATPRRRGHWSAEHGRPGG